ncbi:unnamed protein product [Dicrocoelium dendriticum]|nr:unnamed protein product [Dicrocoelium dendriticum]
MPASARQYLKDKTFIPHRYPTQSAPGYPADGSIRWIDEPLTNDQPLRPVKYLQFSDCMELQRQGSEASVCTPLVPITDVIAATRDGEYEWLAPRSTFSVHTFPQDTAT